MATVFVVDRAVVWVFVDGSAVAGDFDNGLRPLGAGVGGSGFVVVAFTPS